MTVEVLQPGIIVQTLPKVLLSISSSWSLKKKKNAHRLLCTFKEDIYKPNQHFDVLWVGLQVSLFTLPDEPGAVYTLPPPPPAWLRFPRCRFPGWAVGSARWDVCREIKMNVRVCVVLAEESRVCPSFPVNATVFKGVCNKYLLENLPACGSVSQCVWTLMKWHKGKPCATELNRNIHYS